jgi:hypothetical protein
MGMGESLGLAESTASGVTAGTTVPFVNNAQIVLGEDDDPDFSDDGIGAADADPTGTVSASASPALPGSSLASAAGVASASGQSALIWVSVAGVLISILLVFKGKL